ncbi:ankyrin repeat-containing domain protein, partial [Peziza echinospora]
MCIVPALSSADLLCIPVETLKARLTDPSFGLSLHHAAEHGSTAAIAAILDYSRNCTVGRHVGGSTPLHTAIGAGQADCVRLLVARDAPLEEYNNDGQRPLYLAARGGRLDFVQILLDAGADPNSWVDEGTELAITATDAMHVHVCPGALAIAASYGYTAIVQTLLDAGAEV